MSERSKGPSDETRARASGRARFIAGEAAIHESRGRGVVVQETDDAIFVRFADAIVRFVRGTDRLRRIAPWSEGRILPVWDEIDDPARFIPELTIGERAMLRWFDEGLPPDWRIYVRPHLDGDLPSAALLHPRHGAMIWDVVESDGVHLPLQEVLSLRVRRLERIRGGIYGTYIPELAEAVSRDRRYYGTIQLGLYLPNVPARALDPLRGEHSHVQLVTPEDVASLEPSSALPSAFDRLSDARHEQLDQLFGTYYHTPRALEMDPLTPDQMRVAGAEYGQHVLQGVAGSGKTLVLAYRAAAVANRGQRALVATFNRTLTNYVRETLRSTPVEYRTDRVTVQHFHGLLRELLSLPPDGEDEASINRWLEEDWPREAVDQLAEFGVPAKWRFDSVLIDEAQDISTRFLDVIQLLMRSEDSDLMAAVDHAQALYQRESAFSADSRRRGWHRHRLRTSHRLPPEIARVANTFAQRWMLDTDRLEVDEAPLGLAVGTPSVIPAENDQVACCMVARIIEELQGSGARPHDITVLVPSREHGAALATTLADHSIASNHLFLVPATGAPMDGRVGPDDFAFDSLDDRLGRIHYEQSLKRAFVPGDQRVKISTVHSFKGWETDHLVCVLPPEPEEVDLPNLTALYVAITRPRMSLTFVGTDSWDLASMMPTSVVDTPSRDEQRRFAMLFFEAKRRYEQIRRKRKSTDAAENDTNESDVGPHLDWSWVGGP